MGKKAGNDRRSFLLINKELWSFNAQQGVLPDKRSNFTNDPS